VAGSNDGRQEKFVNITGPMRHDVIMAGVGGRGVLMAGLLLAQAGMTEYRNVLWFPSYASTMRGGPCECTVILSNNSIASPMLSRTQAVIIMETSQAEPFENRVQSGGIAIVESTGLSEKMRRDDITTLYIPAVERAVALGNAPVMNLLLLGAYIETTRVLNPEAIDKVLENRLAGRGREQLLALNKHALREGMKAARDPA
jgi:2-oxoglutarate ferredoxin oxidoreductase subunit gamma